MDYKISVFKGSVFDFIMQEKGKKKHVALMLLLRTTCL